MSDSRKIAWWLVMICVTGGSYLAIYACINQVRAHRDYSDVLATTARIHQLPGGQEALEQSGESGDKHFPVLIREITRRDYSQQIWLAAVFVISGVAGGSALKIEKRRSGDRRSSLK